MYFGFSAFIVADLIILCIALAIAWFAAGQFYEIAKMKGHSDKKYFWWCFWLLLVGMMMVIALPDRRSGNVSASTPPNYRSGNVRTGSPGADDLPDL